MSGDDPGHVALGSVDRGALLLRGDKRSEAYLSFFLAMPTMVGAFALDLFKSRHDLGTNDGLLIAVGLVAAFISGLFVVRSLRNFVSTRGYVLFAWWRIIVGVMGMIGLLTVGYRSRVWGIGLHSHRCDWQCPCNEIRKHKVGIQKNG